jgi:vacuolar-type H+-ATPase subunit H
VDIMHLVDRLEDLVDEGRHLFGTKYTMIDEERALEIIDQMRISVPEEIEKSQRIMQQRERILSEAHEEAARIVQQHRLKAEQMVDEDARVQAAFARAEGIKEQARQDAQRMMAEADGYVMEVLKKLEQHLTRDLTEVRNGITHLLEPQPKAAQLPHQPVHIPMPTEQLPEAVEVGDEEFFQNGQ